MNWNHRYDNIDLARYLKVGVKLLPLPSTSGREASPHAAKKRSLKTDGSRQYQPLFGVLGKTPTAKITLMAIFGCRKNALN